MTKKHYEAIATIMKKNSNSYIQYSTYAELLHNANCNKLADYFQTDNPKFNRTRFLEACGIKS